jgi:ribonuclease R
MLCERIDLMPERYSDAILSFLADRQYQPLKTRQLAKAMGVSEDQYGTFRQAVKELHDGGRIVQGSKDTLMLPEMPGKVIGFFRGNPRGFGFVVPDTPNSHGDLFIPPDATGGAISGDKVVARSTSRGQRDGKPSFAGEVIEILQRGTNRFVGELQQTKGAWFVLPDGTQMTKPIVIADIGTAGPKPGSKVVVEIVDFGRLSTDLPSGVIVENLGPKGQLEVETLSAIRHHGLVDEFSTQALEDARAAIAAFDPEKSADRLDLADRTIITIDPPDARDFDDAISLDDAGDGHLTLGVHIADVSHFVREGTALDDEARTRGTSVYFPRKVVPMLPEVLSNGVCSLQEGVKRFCKSAFITYDAQANIVSTRFAETVIASAKRLTYTQAQDICDGKVGGYEPKVIDLIQQMAGLARKIESRRRSAGMLHLDLPDVELVFDDNNKVIDAVPEDNAYTHTIIEMFMVEANDAVAELLDRMGQPFLRRIHPDPDKVGGKQLSTFVHACGQKLSLAPSPQELQTLLATVRGRPESYAINLALLKTFEQAEYSPQRIGHFALASKHYCHFTSPIRRYPDLTVHRLLGEYCHGQLANRPAEDMSALVRLAEHCNQAERQAAAAEEELREVMILQFLATKLGETFQGVITGITNFGIFVQSPRFLIDGLLRLADLGDDWWDVSAADGQVRGQAGGKKFRIGDVIPVQIAGVDIARRQLNLVLDAQQAGGSGQRSRAGSRPGRAGKIGKGQASAGPAKGTGRPAGRKSGRPAGKAKSGKAKKRPGRKGRRK